MSNKSKNRANTVEIQEVEETENEDQIESGKMVAKVDNVKESKTSYDVPALFDQYKTKSAVIRFLNGEGLKTAEIHKVLADAGVTNNAGTEKIRYQHVRNVLKTPVKNTMVPSSDKAIQPQSVEQTNDE